MNRKTDPDAPDISSPPVGVLRSSTVLPWKGIILEHCYYPAGEYIFPAESAHTICLYQGPPSRLEQIRNGQTHSSVVPQGGIQIVPTGTESTWRHPNGADKLRLLLSSELLQQVATDLHHKRVEILDQFSIQDSRIEHISLALLAELAAGGSSGRLYGEGLTTALAAHIISSYSSMPRLLPEITRGLPASLLRRIVSVIEDRLDEDLGLAELASEVGLSQSHFSSLRLMPFAGTFMALFGRDRLPHRATLSRFWRPWIERPYRWVPSATPNRDAHPAMDCLLLCL